MTATAIRTQSTLLGASKPTRDPLPTPRASSAALSAQVLASSSSAQRTGWADDHRLVAIPRGVWAVTTSGIVWLQSSNSLASGGHVDLAAGHHGQLRRGIRTKRRGILYADNTRSRDRSRSSAMSVDGREPPAATIWPRSGRAARPWCAVAARPARCRAPRPRRGDVGAGGLDHRASPAHEVEEPVVVDARTRSPVWNQPSASKDSSRLRCGTLHQIRPADAQLARDPMHHRPGNPGAGIVRMSHACSNGWLVSSPLSSTLPPSVTPSMLWHKSMRGRTSGRHDGVGLPLPHRRQVRLPKLGAGSDAAMPATKPFVTVGCSASSRSRSRPARPHWNRSGSNRRAGWPAGRSRTPIQKNGELQNNRSPGVSPRISLRLR